MSAVCCKEYIINICISICIILHIISRVSADLVHYVSPKKSVIWGPGLRANFSIPVRYFYVQLVSEDGSKLTDSTDEGIVSASIVPASGARVRIRTQVLDRHDGSYIVRYRPYSSTSDLQISVHLNGRHIGESPYIVKGNIYHETCNCPHQTTDEWAEAVGCPQSYLQIRNDLEPFDEVDMSQVSKAAVARFSEKGRRSICHYKIINNKVYRKCYGEHVGFKMFADAILLSLTRKMFLPDLEFFMNLGDWPLENKALTDKPIPIMSWCGSKNSFDIVLPTYDITESTLQMMGRVSLDIFSTQANTGPKWANKTSIAFWRGRDSRRERLQLTEMSQKHPNLLDARLTNMFFFPKDEAKYGKLAPQISFFEFFKYKYQLNIDGTVAAYRLPYLLVGDAVVLKQESDYYEHFYHELKPYVHYIPIKHDLGDLLERIKWAKANDDLVKHISKRGQEYARDHLTPDNIMCYHVRLFQEYTKLLIKRPKGIKDFELVDQPQETQSCSCFKEPSREEL